MPTEADPDRHTELAANRTAEAAERTKETAVRTTVAAQRTEASADRRTELAANRTVLAARAHLCRLGPHRADVAGSRGGGEKDAGRGAAGMGGRADRLGAGGVRRLLLRRRGLARAVSGHTAAPARRAPPPAGTAVRIERLPRASGARRAARRLVWPHRRELTLPSVPGKRLQVR